MRISFNQRFVNKAGNNLVPGKIHTIRQNYEYWKRFEGQEVELFAWEGKPYRSKQKVFCVKRIVSVEEVELEMVKGSTFFKINGKLPPAHLLAENDGFTRMCSFFNWFGNYKPGKMAIIHFTDFRY